MRFAAGLVMITIGVVVGSIVLRELDAWYKESVLMAIIGIALTPVFLIHRILPPPLEITAWKDSVEFEFTSAQFARTFAELNDCEWLES
jgi:hypothetical protein